MCSPGQRRCAEACKRRDLTGRAAAVPCRPSSVPAGIRPAPGIVARLQVIEAGPLPDPVLAGSYGMLLRGSGIADVTCATLTVPLLAAGQRRARVWGGAGRGGCAP